MANKYLNLQGLTTYDEKIKEKITTDDAATLQSAKEYADSLSDNYDPAGQAATLVEALENGQVATNKSDIDTLKSGKADKSTTLAGYGIGDAYTKAQTDSAIQTAVANADHLKREIVSVLPEVEEADEHTIYMVGTGAGSENSVYEEYMLVNGGFEKIGSSEVDLTNYALKSYVDSAKSEAINTAGINADSKISTKVGDIGGSTVKQYVDQAETDAVNTAKSYADGLAGNYATKAQGAKADTALQKADVTSGTANGTIAVKGTDVAVKGLASAAYKVAGVASGNVPVNGAALGTTANVPVVTNTSGQLIPHASGALGTAAFSATTAFDAAGTASSLVTELSEGQVTTNTNDITTLKGQVAALEEGGGVTAITDEEIEALFA
ncbi:hypothetical protein H9X90_04885 [Faecalicatena contorta]|uniref:hypothetical protein n=1 Tax=Faecalicatena contorta TaxID=39482 RepID=UPI0019603582|nr:hypothetical protein [Faecalicatena contorta]MBM6686916.1 hypothetical protein [Faecalicatena contorta]MBM6710086.1 hypothetical protein [Faecalicatena contorta]